MRKLKNIFSAIAVIITSSIAGNANAGQTNVAVAANFTEAAKEIATAFRAKTGHDAILSFGSTGQLYTQIKQHAPFQIFLAADEDRPKQLVDEGLGVASSRFTYATGRLVLWSKNPDLVRGADTLRGNGFSRLAIANPIAAPYGAAAVEALRALGVYDRLQPKIVRGANVVQTFQFIDTGNAELGFVALSQLIGNNSGSRWQIPQNIYTPVRQDAVLITTGVDNEAATAFMDFLKGPGARGILEKYGYAAGASDGGHDE
ncbi:molybdate ABC transporter substrate-binding protein [Camelimonas lactis]|uniref:Molybdate transport system substrate-binding protein n=1 Tax=Camelimonas lactis TaxID=659006 RepID=A0A4R2GSB9_9HYPH|nr:molybdate ABC transporter substrate-binding protein [Camelimonas lactis]TCO12817.1 molybdate transport system substrate-binding protein [Camelimonas lactis]